MKVISKVVVVGGGTAGFIAALALKMKLPQLRVVVIRSPDIGIIGVGEGSTPPFTHFIHDFLGIPIQEFVRATEPGLKTGTCFLWGARPRFFFPFGHHMDLRAPGTPRAVGYYFNQDDFEHASPASSRMHANRVFGFNAQQTMMISPDYAYHVENERFAAYLESKALAAGVEIINGTIEQVQQDDDGITSLTLADSATADSGSISADLYVDCSGFRSLLLGKTFAEPFISYRSTLACDRAVVGGWARPAGEPMLSYTVSQTMDAGWCWRIDHPQRINRGYVFSSAFVSDQEAEDELRAKNPLIGPTRVVRFVSGRYQRSWVKNVVAIGNASGFVEPLEATSLAILATRSQLLVELLQDSGLEVSAPISALFNQNTSAIWDAVRDFLSLHYRFNNRLSTPFWLDRQANTDIGNAQPLIDYYQKVGPSPAMTNAFVTPVAVFGANSYLAILAGIQAPTSYSYKSTDAENQCWHSFCAANAQAGRSCTTTEQTLQILGAGKRV